MNTIFVTGIGTDVGKTISAAILTEALEADYWKPVQAGYDEGTDALTVQSLISNKKTVIHKETYKLKLPASPHIAAREESIKIDLNKIEEDFFKITNELADSQRYLIVEGAGGIMVPLNESEFVISLVKKLNAKVVLVSRNYLGSINHSLLTAAVCKQYGLDVLGWIFNDRFMQYENEIAGWSGYPVLATIPFAINVNVEFIKQQASVLKQKLAM